MWAFNGKQIQLWTFLMLIKIFYYYFNGHLVTLCTHSCSDGAKSVLVGWPSMENWSFVA